MRHLERLRTIQKETGGFTEFVPLSFVHQEAPMHVKHYLPDLRPGPTGNEVARLYAIARLMLGPSIRNIQVSWVKEGIRMGQWLCRAAPTISAARSSTRASRRRRARRTGSSSRPPICAASSARRAALPVQRDTRYRRLRTFGATAAPDEETALDRVADSEATFGSYAQLTHDARFRFKLPVARD